LSLRKVIKELLTFARVQTASSVQFTGEGSGGVHCVYETLLSVSLTMLLISQFVQQRMM
jgi:hypothetical protein